LQWVLGQIGVFVDLAAKYLSDDKWPMEYTLVSLCALPGHLPRGAAMTAVCDDLHFYGLEG